MKDASIIENSAEEVRGEVEESKLDTKGLY
jgi:hypothetical protein